MVYGCLTSALILYEDGHRWNNLLGKNTYKRIEKLNKQSPYITIGEDMASYEFMLQIGFRLVYAQTSLASIRSGAEIVFTAMDRIIDYRTRLGFYDNFRMTPPKVKPVESAHDKRIKRMLADIDEINAIFEWDEKHKRETQSSLTK